MQLGIGAVQFGLTYGLYNQARVAQDEIEKILDFAKTQGVQIIDTSTAYGDSEKALGLTQLTHQSFSVVTKTPTFKVSKLTSEHGKLLKKTFQNSLHQLNLDKTFGLLVHNPDDFLADGAEYLYEALHELKSLGKVTKIGVSVYSPEELEQILSRFDLDLVQCPVNVFDQRFIASGMLAEMKRSRIEVHARSIFLQGVLLSLPKSLPPYFDVYASKIADYHQTLAEQDMTPLEAALQFVRDAGGVDIGLIGVHSLAQLKEVVLAFTQKSKKLFDAERFAGTDMGLIDPRGWKK